MHAYDAVPVLVPQPVMSLVTRAVLLKEGAMRALLVLYMASRVRYVASVALEPVLPAVVSLTRPLTGGTKENQTDADSPDLLSNGSIPKSACGSSSSNARTCPQDHRCVLKRVSKHACASADHHDVSVMLPRTVHS